MERMAPAREPGLSIVDIRGIPVEVEIRGERAAAEVVTLPFYRRLKEDPR